MSLSSRRAPWSLPTEATPSIVTDGLQFALLPLATPLHSAALFQMLVLCPRLQHPLLLVSVSLPLSRSPTLGVCCFSSAWPPGPLAPGSPGPRAPWPRPRTTPCPPEPRLLGVWLSSAGPARRLPASARHVPRLGYVLSPLLVRATPGWSADPLWLCLIILSATSWPRPRGCPHPQPSGFAVRLPLALATPRAPSSPKPHLGFPIPSSIR